MSEDPLTVDQKWEYVFTRSPHHPFIIAKLCFEIQHFLISKGQYFVSTILSRKKIFENFSQLWDAITSVVLMKQVTWSPTLPQINTHTENQSPAANRCNKKRLLPAVSTCFQRDPGSTVRKTGSHLAPRPGAAQDLPWLPWCHLCPKRGLPIIL